MPEIPSLNPEEPAEMTKKEKAAFDSGREIGHRIGTLRERALSSKVFLQQTTEGQDALAEKERALESMDDQEKAAFEKGFKQGEEGGKQWEGGWQAAQKK